MKKSGNIKNVIRIVVVGIIAGVFIWAIAMALTILFKGTSSAILGSEKALAIMSLMSTAIAAIASGMVIAQLRDNAEARKKGNEVNVSNFYNKFTNYWKDWGMIFVNHPELRKYFYDGVEVDENGEDFQRIMAVATYMDDLFVYSQTEVERLKVNFDILPQKQYESYKQYMEWMKQSPAYKTYLKYYGKNINRFEDNR